MTTPMRLKPTAVLFGACLFVTTGPVWAGDKENALIDKVVATYGGDKLLNLKSFVVVDKYNSFRYGQSQSPDEVDLHAGHSSVTVDLVNKRKNFRWVLGSKEEFRTQHQLFDGKTGYSIRHTERTLTENAGMTYATVDRRHMYYLDTALVLMLKDNRKNASYEGEQSYRGSMHDLVKFKAEGEPEMTLFVNRENGRVGKMQRDYWAGGYFNYSFSDYEKKQGVLYAANNYVTRAGQPYNVSVSRKIEFNKDVSNEFNRPKGYGTPGGKSLDFSKMNTTKLADNLYLVGYDWGFSIFFDAGDYFIGAGGYKDLTERFEAMKAFAKVDKPLKYQVVSHHHNDHLGGMKEAFDLGVIFIADKDNIADVRRMAKVDIPDNRFIIVDGQGSYADGALKVVDFPNGHATHNLMSYFPSAKTLFSADMFGSRQASGVDNGGESNKKLRSALKQAGFKVEHFAAAHSGRVLTAADLDKSTGPVVDEICPTDWAICEGR
ncbi:MAG: hypothetical protein MJK04_19975 [Psychrosphaera sp.]|nr:hypothetical protein [Psychrosphaera sp.]